MNRPKLLDLFCGAGGAAMGYSRAGSEVVGVDIKPQPRYPFEFHQADAMTYPLEGFDAIHASPPCQAFTTMGNRWRKEHPDFIAATRARLEPTLLPYILENVHGARRKLVNPLMLSGGMFGLGVHRPRFFEVNFNAPLPPIARPVSEPLGVYGKLDGRRLWTRTDGSEQRNARTLAEARDAMGIDWMEWDELTEAIPPAYTEFIGKTLLAQLEYVTVREAIGDLPEPGESDVAIYEWDDEDYYRDACSGLFLPRSDYQREIRKPPEVPQPVGTAISLFSGCGGFDLGTTMAGFETRVFIEMNADACKTIMQNAAAFGWLDAVIFNCDIRKLEVQQVLYAARLQRGECDLVTGGFPCQPFSQSGARKGTKGPRGNLFYECSRMIDGIQPRTFVLENVPGILTSSGGKDISVICREFNTLGYDFAIVKLNAVDYSVPQDRLRVFFVGVRPDVAAEGESALSLVQSMVAGATHYDPATQMPSFAPIYRWNGRELLQTNDPAPGQVVGSVNAAKHRRERETNTDDPSLFEAVV